MALSLAGDLLSFASDQVLNNSIADQLNISTEQLFNISSDQLLSVVHRICQQSNHQFLALSISASLVLIKLKGSSSFLCLIHICPVMVKKLNHSKSDEDISVSDPT
jgi:hypothetical protein